MERCGKKKYHGGKVRAVGYLDGGTEYSGGGPGGIGKSDLLHYNYQIFERNNKINYIKILCRKPCF